MKFTIFKWWESWVKPLIYIVMLAATAGLILWYCFIKDDGGTLTQDMMDTLHFYQK